MGAVFEVPLADFDEPGGTRVALVPGGGTPLPELELDGDVVFVLGSERDGLPDDVLARCEARASIPHTGGVDSLNVAMAGTIALYELSRRRDRPSGTAS
jgi:tRNA G18 (ribose-2'-O)-methylase SpoU